MRVKLISKMAHIKEMQQQQQRDEAYNLTDESNTNLKTFSLKKKKKIENHKTNLKTAR